MLIPAADLRSLEQLVASDLKHFGKSGELLMARMVIPHGICGYSFSVYKVKAIDSYRLSNSTTALPLTA
jgi:hypothetical protein